LKRLGYNSFTVFNFLADNLQLRSSTPPIETEATEDPKSHLQQIRALKIAYDSYVTKEPYLPSAESPIPALLALRTIDQSIQETQTCITTTEADLQKVQKRLEKEQAHLRDAKLIQAGLETRISSLEETLEERTQKTPGQVAKGMMRDLRKKKQYYENETKSLVKAFNGFIDEHLAPMLAAEELGGPVVGGILDVDEEMLEAGFSTQGKARKLKANVNVDKRQRRIDEIWGPPPPMNGKEEGPWNEQRAAAAEMRDLTEQLLNSLVEAGGNGPGAYVELERESAAARFLVRSKVAEFHPRDATKLRLIDFGGELDD